VGASSATYYEAVRQEEKMKSVRFLIAMLPVLAWALGHAGASAAAESPMHDAATPGSLEIRTPHGRYVGVVVDGKTRRFADALLTKEGKIRIHIGGPDMAGTGAIPTRRSRSAQFVGRLFVENGVIRGSGRLLGENCTLPNPVRFCQAPASAMLKIQAAQGAPIYRLIASITVTSGAGVEIWQVVLDSWDHSYPYPVSLRMLRGLYSESTAEFSGNGTTIIDVAAGRMFFQSPATGCVGNGKMTPRRDVGVVDVELTIENCRGRFAYLNGRYLGFSTFSPSNYWNYDTNLRTWLAKPASSARPAALTMWSIPR
jgi:hypothetical protein